MACNSCLIALKGTDQPAPSLTEKIVDSKTGPVLVVLGSAIGVFLLAKYLFGDKKR